MRKFMSLLLALSMLLTLAPAALADEAAAEPAATEITIFHTNDVHARIDNSAGMGYAMASGYIEAARAAGENVLVLDAGDTLHGMPIATVVEGESVVDVLNAVGYDAMVPGNHDYNYGVDRLIELKDMLQFPVLACNVVYKENGNPVFQPYTIKEFGDVKIGIIGVDNPEIESSIAPARIADISYEDGVECVKAAVEEIKDSTDAIIVLTHWGLTGVEHPSTETLALIEGVDLVVDGHSHTVLENGQPVEGGALVVSTGEYLNNLGKVAMTIDGGEVSVSAQLIPKPEAYPNEAINEAIAGIEADQAPYLNEVIGQVPVYLEGAREIVRTGESNLANIIGDAILTKTGADFVMINGGGIRASIEAGDLTRGEMISVLPFGNQVVTIKVTGADIRAALENGVKFYPETAGAFPQVAGGTYSFDAGQEAGSRIVDVTIGGEPLDDAKEYTLATNDYMATGGDDYATLNKAVEMYFGGLDEALIEYMSTLDEADYPEAGDGRIAVVDGAEVEAAA